MNKQIFLAVSLCLASQSFAQSYSGRAIQDSVQGSAKLSSGAIHAIAATGQLTSAALAVPLSLGASAGMVSGRISADLIRAANAPIGTPLPVCEETLTITAPNEALKNNGKAR